MKIIEATSQTITRPNDSTAYTIGDLVANNVTAGSVTPFSLYIPYGRGLELMRAALIKSTATVANSSFRLHLFRDSPTVTNGDNGALSALQAGYFGSVDVTGATPTLTGSGRAVGSAATNFVINTDLDQLVFVLVEALAAYAPGAQETFSLQLVGKSYV